MAAPSPARVQQLANDLLRIAVISPDQYARAVDRSTDGGFAKEFQAAAATSGGSREIWLNRLLGPAEQPLGLPEGRKAAVAAVAASVVPYSPDPEPPAWAMWGQVLLAVGAGLLLWGFFYGVSISSSSYGRDIMNLDLIQTKLTILILGAVSFVSGMVALAAASVIKWTR